MMPSGISGGLQSALRVVRDQRNLLNRINLIWVVQSFSQKDSGSLSTQITCISLAIPAHTEGRFAIVTDVGSGDAVDPGGAAQPSCEDEARIWRTAKSGG